jgi:hypothetical protein
MLKSDKSKLVLRFLIFVMLITCLALFSTGAGRTFISSSILSNSILSKDNSSLPSKNNKQRNLPVAFQQKGAGAPQSSDAASQEKATPIQVGVMTEKQRAHSKLYGEYGMGRKLDAIPAREFKPGVEPGVYRELGTPVTSPDAPILSFADFMRNLSCEADAVVVATIKDHSSQLTENKEFIFTDYEAEVDAIYKNNPATPIAPHSLITVTRPGGRVEINGRVVGATDASFKLFSTGKQYLLFLKYLPQTSDYQSIGQGAFLISDNTLTAMSEESLPGGIGGSRPFTDELRNALDAVCSK